MLYKNSLLSVFLLPLVVTSVQKNSVQVENNVKTEVNGSSAKVETNIHTNVNGSETTVKTNQPGEVKVETKDGETKIETSGGITPTIIITGAANPTIEEKPVITPSVAEERKNETRISEELEKIFLPVRKILRSLLNLFNK